MPASRRPTRRRWPRASAGVGHAGSRNAPTPLLIASTPVIAVQPLAKARNSSQAPASTAPGGTGVDRPVRMSAARHGGISAEPENTHEV